jgi:hypothetical protein
MANFILVQLLILLFAGVSFAKVDRIYLESYLGEKDLGMYSERYQPLLFQDIYHGEIVFQDELFFRNYFNPYLFNKEAEYSYFLKSEMNAGLVCSDELLAQHFDDIRYSYRLITISYLLENNWHMKLMSDSLYLKNGCQFNLKAWVDSCKPKSAEMKKFTDRLKKFLPRYEEKIPVTYSKQDWIKDFSKKDFKWQSQYRLKDQCKNCSEKNLPEIFNKTCEADQKLMTQICSEEDSLYGLSQNRDAYYLLGLSNIINPMNKQGEAMGCMRRFSEVMAHKELRPESLNYLFPFLQSFLRQKYQERFLQGRVFFFGSGREFEEKGLAELYVEEQPLKLEKLPPEPVEPKPEIAKVEPVKKTEPVVVAKVETPVIKPTPIKEIKKATKSAFLLAAEVRKSSDLDQVEVDMLKLRYDYIFSLNMINTLSERLKTFMTREALIEMASYDKLGTKDGPVPLMFLKYMIDMQEHHGLWNLTSVVGSKFYVSNEIDSAFSPVPEYVQLVNDESTGNQWKMFILKP